jgi:CRP/FNR family transcriptional regulator
VSDSAKVIDLSQLAAACGQCRMQELCLPHGLDPEEIAAIEAIVRRSRPLQRGACLYRQGDRFRSLYAVRSGSAKTVLSSPDGLEQVTGFFLPGELIGFDGLKDERHHCTAVALETSTICELPYDRIEGLCGQLPGLLRRMLKLIGREITDEQELLLLISHCTAQERLATFFVSVSTRMSARGFSATVFNLSMSRADMASYLGIEPETVSRQLRQLEAQGLVTVDQRHVVLKDPAGLRALAERTGPCRVAHTP